MYLAFEGAPIRQLNSPGLQLDTLTLSQDLAHIGLVHYAAALLLNPICNHITDGVQGCCNGVRHERGLQVWPNQEVK